MRLEFTVSCHFEKRRNEGTEREATALGYPLCPVSVCLQSHSQNAYSDPLSFKCHCSYLNTKTLRLRETNDLSKITQQVSCDAGIQTQLCLTSKPTPSPVRSTPQPWKRVEESQGHTAPSFGGRQRPGSVYGEPGSRTHVLSD